MYIMKHLIKLVNNQTFPFKTLDINKKGAVSKKN